MLNKLKIFNTIIISLAIMYIVLLLKTEILYSQGTVVQDSLLSTSLGYYKKVNVYLPQGYNPNGSTRYRVVYFLHGAGGNQASYPFIYGILDSMISNLMIQPVIMVKPDGSRGPYAGSFYTNSVLYGQFENFIYNDVVQFIDTKYLTQAFRNSRVIMGHSMGGYGCMKAALSHSSLFRGAASHSGPLDLYHVVDAIPFVLAESGNGPPYTYNPANGVFSLLGFTMCGAFSPNRSNPPYNIDFLLNSNGVIIASVFDRWKPHNPARLSSNISASTNLALYFDCGLQDELTLLGWNNSFRDTLNTRNIPHRYLTYTGNHTNQLPNRFPVSLRFLDSVMGVPVGIDPIGNGLPTAFKLHQNYPNPFNPGTKIKFQVASLSGVKIVVFDVLGREVETLVNEQLQPGTYEVNWDGSNFTSGIYYYILQTKGFTDTKKMILLK